MPIEIREVLIKAVVDPQAGSGAQGGGNAAANASGSGAGTAADTVAESVKKVFEMLRDKEER